MIAYWTSRTLPVRCLILFVFIVVPGTIIGTVVTLAVELLMGRV